jgi:hypothetical protein
MFDHLETIVRMAVLVGRRQPLLDVDAPRSVEPWTLAENDPDDTGTWCTRCQAVLPAGDTSAVRERGATYHAACWLGRGSESPVSDRQLAGR